MHKIFVVLVATVLAAPSIALAQKTVLNWQEQPLYSTQNLSSGFHPDPVQIPVRAGGRDAVPSYLGPECRGYVNAARPDVKLNYSAGSYALYLYTVAAADTTLVVYMPDGTWRCSDDGGGSLGDNPMLRVANAQSGNYNIWIGVYGEATAEDATLYISEINPLR